MWYRFTRERDVRFTLECSTGLILLVKEIHVLHLNVVPFYSWKRSTFYTWMWYRFTCEGDARFTLQCDTVLLVKEMHVLHLNVVKEMHVLHWMWYRFTRERDACFTLQCGTVLLVKEIHVLHFNRGTVLLVKEMHVLYLNAVTIFFVKKRFFTWRTQAYSLHVGEMCVLHAKEMHYTLFTWKQSWVVHRLHARRKRDTYCTWTRSRST